MPKLEHTSVPSWAVGGPAADAAPAGTSHVLVGVGEAGRRLVADRARALGPAVRVILGDDVGVLGAELGAALADGRVGIRVHLVGPVGSCLALRSVALGRGIEDDELAVVPVGGGAIPLWCVHCAATTDTEAEIDDVVPCSGCGRSLVVYHHVSRRTGRFLGFQIDAETAPSSPSSTDLTDVAS